MDNQIISVFGSKILLEIINEIKFFSKFKIIYFDNIDLCLKSVEKQGGIGIIFIKTPNKDFINNINNDNFPVILITDTSTSKNDLSGDLKESLNIPFKISDLEKKIVTLFAKNEFKNNSLIYLSEYIIDKNERKIKKNNLELQLSEKEINFLVLFSESKEPINRNVVLKKVWNYSLESETHTIETHIHRLRKKILEKFGDNNFIKNNNKGYYI